MSMHVNLGLNTLRNTLYNQLKETTNIHLNLVMPD